MTTNRPEKLDDALIRPGRVDHQVAFGNATQTQIRELFERMYTNDLPRTTFVKAASSVSDSATRTNRKLPAIKWKQGPLTPPVTSSATPSEYANGSANGHVISNGHAKPSHRSVDGVVVLGEKDNGEVSEEELKRIAREFSIKVPDDKFSPAEVQGFLLKRKKDPRKALVDIENWVQGMMEIKEKGTKLVKVQ
jgi:mitochondrial chaperone BCS1